MSRRILAVALALPLALLVAAPAAWGQASSRTEVFKNQTDRFTEVLPCVGGNARITTTYNGVFHITRNSNGVHVTGTTTGTFVANPLRAGIPTYRGHFTQRFGENATRKSANATFTFTVIGRAAGGSTIKFHETAHYTMSASGFEMGFDKATCH